MSYQEEIVLNLQAWRTQIGEIQSRSASVETRQQMEFERQLDLLHAKQNHAEEMLRQYRMAGSDTERDEIKARLDGICNEIENALDSAWAKLGS